MHKAKTIERHNDPKQSENELKMNIRPVTLYLSQFNESKLMSGRTLRKLFLTFFFFYGTAKSICELRHTFFINLRLRQILNLRYPALFYKNLRSAAGKFAHSVVCGNTYAPPGIIITRHNTGTELALLFCFVFFCLKQKQ